MTRYEMIDAPVTLNGEPAKVSGAQNAFATVTLTGHPYLGAEWAWSTVEYIITSRRGRFLT